MRIRSPCDGGDDLGNAQLGALLDRPFHTIKLEDGEKQSEFGSRRQRNFVAEFELDPRALNRMYARAAHDTVGRDIELLPHTGAKHSHQVIGVLAGEGRALACYLVGDPAAASHFAVLVAVLIAVLGSQFSVNARARGDWVWRVWKRWLSPYVVQRGQRVPGHTALNVGLAPENIFHLPQQGTEQGLVIDLGGGFQFLQQLALALAELGGNLHADLHI